MTRGTGTPETTLTRPEPGRVEVARHEPGVEADPWEGIPAELLDGEHSYDLDTPGGCG